MQDQERIISKIQKLLARGDASRNDNEHEREIAMRQATALMDKHQISMLDVSAETEEIGHEEQTVGNQEYRGCIYVAVSKLYGCSCWASGRGKAKRVLVAGKPTARATTIAVSSFLIESIEREARRYAGMGRSYIASWKKGAMSGVVGTANTMIKARREEHQDTQTATGTSLAVVYDRDTKEATEWRDNFVPKLGKSRGTRASNYEGYNSGKRYGASLNINRPIGGRQTSLLT